MLTLFQRRKPAPPELGPSTPPKGLTLPEPAASLLATPRRRKLLDHIWLRTSLSRKQFATLYAAPLERYAELVQQFPASESHHHAYPGGMLDHGLEIVAYALKLRQSHLLPAGTTPEDQAAQAEAWTAAIAYAALLHDIGKVAVDLHVEYGDGTVWHPWHGPLSQPYRFRYRDDREYRLHGAATGLLYGQILDPNILDWLSDYPDLWRFLLYVLAGQYEHAGVLGELVVQADRASVAQELGGDPSRAMAAPRTALQRKLVEGLRYLLKEELKLNQPQASDGWLTQDALWLVSKTCSDKLRAHLLSQGMEGIPSSNTAVFNVLQEHGVLLPTPNGKAIWKATVTSATGWSHSFTLLRLSAALIWEATERPAAYTGTVMIDTAASETSELEIDIAASEETPPPLLNARETAPPVTEEPNEASVTQMQIPDAMEDLLTMIDAETQSAGAAHAPPSLPGAMAPVSPSASPAAAENVMRRAAEIGRSLSPIEEPSGKHFLTWLRNGITTHKLVINDARALVHTIEDTVYLVSPGVFQRYSQEHPRVAELAKQEKLQDWQWMQKRFEKMLLHRKQSDGLNIWTCQVVGPRKTRKLHGYLLEDPRLLFSDPPPNNPYLSLTSKEPETTQ
ncbi:TPA: MobH family relaxase [Pseudomonas aeruginosa]